MFETFSYPAMKNFFPKDEILHHSAEGKRIEAQGYFRSAPVLAANQIIMIV